jgi:hypothetical protein
MPAGNPNERVQTRNSIFPRVCCLIGKTVGLMAWFGLLVGSNRGVGGETSLTEYQVKSIFLLNFAKYVDWPPTAFAATNTPIVISVIGEGKIGGELAKTVEGKSVDGRPIVIRQIQTPEDLDKCHILFIGSSEKTGLVEILSRINSKPVLTVGETDQFMEQGGVINFVKKEGKIRLEINLDAARDQFKTLECGGRGERQNKVSVLC